MIITELIEILQELAQDDPHASVLTVPEQKSEWYGGVLQVVKMNGNKEVVVL